MHTKSTTGVREVANRVPQVTADFWLVKLLAVTMGETAADYLAVNLGLGLAVTSWIMSAILVVFIWLQFRQKRYVPWPYWTAVVMISVVGTLITDNLVDNLGVPLETTTAFFTVALALTFAVWYWVRAHALHPYRRHHAARNLLLAGHPVHLFPGHRGRRSVAEKFELGYLATGVLFLAIIVAFCIAWLLKANAVLTFWFAYIFTRPLGASIGDLLSQPPEYGGLGFGTIVTSALFLACIVATVAFMTVTRRGQEFAAVALPSRQST